MTGLSSDLNNKNHGNFFFFFFFFVSLLYVLQDDLDKNIRKLMNELECANRKCEIYRSNLLSVLKAVEDHKLELSVKVENIKISMKDGI